MSKQIDDRAKELTEMACDIATTRNISPQEALMILRQSIGIAETESQLTALSKENKRLRKERNNLYFRLGEAKGKNRRLQQQLNVVAPRRHI